MNIRYCIVWCLLFCGCNCARILGVFPYPGYSQYMLGSALMKSLASKGHEVMVISPFQQSSKIENYREIVIKDSDNPLARFDVSDIESKSSYSGIYFMYAIFGVGHTEDLLKISEVQELLKSNTRFDLVICEHFFNEAHFGFAHHFKAPLIIMSTMPSTEWAGHLVGNPFQFSVNPIGFSPHSDTMDFKQRLRNTMYGIFQGVVRDFIGFPAQNRLLQNYFPNPPKLSELLFNVSLVLLNSNIGISPVVPTLPNMIEIGGFHIAPKELPNELKTFLDEATEGAIYFSMGTNLNGDNFNEKLSKSILECFATLKQRVLWKWEDIPNVPKNVKNSKWFSQQDVLAHPNMRLFITHGGFLSIMESIYNGVPIIGIPIFGDQKMNVAVAVSKGYGLKIPFRNLSKRTLCETINKMIANDTYKHEARQRSDALKNQPMKPIDKAIFWIEYVLRNKGAPYLRSTALRLTWFQYYLIDVFLCMVLIFCVTILMIGLVVKLLFVKKKTKKYVKRD